MSDKIDFLADLCFILGPKPGYNREVLLWNVAQWRVPSSDLVNHLFRELDAFDVTAQEHRDFGARRATPAYEAALVHLHCAVLSKPRFELLTARLAQAEVSMFRFFTHREIIDKTSSFDWHTVGMLLYVFEHLDR